MVERLAVRGQTVLKQSQICRDQYMKKGAQFLWDYQTGFDRKRGPQICSVKPEAQDAVDDAQVGRSFATCLHLYNNTFSLLISSKLTMAISVSDIKVKHAKYHAVSSLCYSYSSHFKYSEMHTTC